MDCPTDDQLRCLARGTEAGSGLDEHVRRCAACQERLESLAGDSGVLAELRSAWADKLNDSAERRIAQICDDVAAKLPRAGGERPVEPGSPQE